jgi:L-ribulose-5-phosphate 4-epimerase
MALLKELKEHVWKCNMELFDKGLVAQTFGNVSGLDRESGILAIKPSGIPYSELKPEQMVLVDLNNRVIDGNLNPSSDTKTHTVLYKAFPLIGGIVHTHSTYATAWAQAKKPIPCFGTTHADYIQTEIPCTEDLSDEQIVGDYEIETGNQIVKRLWNLSYNEVQVILVAGHAPFSWGLSSQEAVQNAIMLEEIAKLALLTLELNPVSTCIKKTLLNKHYLRKHSVTAYYGQR